MDHLLSHRDTTTPTPAELPPNSQNEVMYNCCDAEITGEGVQWAYSTCTGRKKALLIGINYTGTKDVLHGCVNDAVNLRKFITEKWGYEEGDITTLADDPGVSSVRPTKANIIAHMKALVAGAEQNDALFMFYSGHGSQIKDFDANEADGEDEVLCPVDFDEEGFIEDDYIKELIVDPLPIGCRLTVIFDCCHSGSALDLLYTYTHKGHIKDGANPDDPKKSPADIVYMSGCRDDQKSRDTEEEGKATGALSHAFVETLTSTPPPNPPNCAPPLASEPADQWASSTIQAVADDNITGSAVSTPGPQIPGAYPTLLPSAETVKEDLSYAKDVAASALSAATEYAAQAGQGVAGAVYEHKHQGQSAQVYEVVTDTPVEHVPLQISVVHGGVVYGQRQAEHIQYGEVVLVQVAAQGSSEQKLQ
ncbi:hypothetical protein NMY22_g10215 [Coprinellus aureogranulatus]|nr:hypothetical protein NMY22_g10215 [Coprinellus aureogranulatus]